MPNNLIFFPEEIEGIVACSDSVSYESLLDAYPQGLFPWPYDEHHPVFWYNPKLRSILSPNSFHLSRSFLKRLRQMEQESKYIIETNLSFKEVIEGCAKARPFTWITADLKNAYCKLFESGFAYCLALRNQEHQLLAGIYGTCFNKFISAESMFSIQTDSSKILLFELITRLKENQIPWLDIQVSNPFTQQLGAQDISRQTFLNDLSKFFDFESPEFFRAEKKKLSTQNPLYKRFKAIE